MGHCGSRSALLSAAAEMFNCDVMVRGISCDNKNSADTLSLLKSIVLQISASGTDINN